MIVLSDSAQKAVAAVCASALLLMITAYNPKPDGRLMVTPSVQTVNLATKTAIAFPLTPELTETPTNMPSDIASLTTVTSTAVTAPSGLIYTSDHALWMTGADGQPAQMGTIPEVSSSFRTWLSPDHTMILYDDWKQCWVVDLADKHTTRITEAPLSYVSCQWSLDSQKIYYTDGMDVWAISVHDVAVKQNLTQTPERFEERLLPLQSGRPDVLFFYSRPLDETPDGVGWTGALTAVNTDGTQYRIITDTLSADLPALSPDGQTLAYIAGYTLYLYRWNAEIQQVDLQIYNSEAREVQFTSPAWSPDGAQIAGWAEGNLEDEPFYGIMVLDHQTNTSRILDPLYHPIFWDSHPPAPEWSPDGQWLIYWGQDENAGYLGFHVVSADGQQMHTLAFESDDEKRCANPWAVGKWAWSPDGQWLAFTRCEGREGTEYIKHGIFLTEIGQWNVFQIDLPKDAEPVGWIETMP
ncbi:MAG: PD40 domain-containing protein [Anaerolineae bacterium]|nr:PD40 domain-containing protein [Anaerolineae bacterium]